MSRAQIGPVRVAAALVLAETLALAACVATSGRAWVGRPFPGFLLLRNRVIASISLPGWPVADARDVFQGTVVAVDDVPVAGADEVYARVWARPAGTRFQYTIERNGERSSEGFESRIFGWRDAAFTFGVYLFDGIVFATIGVWVWALSPRRTSTWALLGLCLALSTYVLTAIDLYGPHRFFALHALAESFVPGALVHLALLFPVRRASPSMAALVAYLPATALALVYEWRLDVPSLYPGVHSIASAGIVAGGVALLAGILWSYLTSSSELVRHQVRVVGLGGVAAFAAPAMLFGVSVLEGGRVPVNIAAFTAFLFPLSIAFAVQKRDLFAIDVLVQRGFYYAILSGLVSATYVALAALAAHGLHLSRVGQSTTFSLAFTLGMLLLLPGVRDRVQRVVDRLFGRRSYDVQEVLATASTALGATLSLEEILRLTVGVPARVLGLRRVAVFLQRGPGFEEAAAEPATAPAARSIDAGTALVQRLASLPPPLVRDGAAGPESAGQEAWLADLAALDADLIVPLGCQGILTGFLACGRPQSGAFFSAGDVSFLHTFANQAALSLQNARTFHDLELLNADLERRVEERTQQLASSTEQLSASLEQLGTAYRNLEASQEQLVAAQKMAAFGRLAAGIAHEMNTPLGAALNGLRIAQELAAECEALADDASTPEADRRTAFGELTGMIGSIDEWTRKAAAYIKSIKAQGRNAGGGAAAWFDVGRLLENELQPLLMHRLRLIGGTLELRLGPALPELWGDAGRLGQVLANLINNAIDACEGLPPDRTRIVIEADRDGDDVVLRVADRGTGIPAEAQDQIFEAFYTTKPPGKGTGLGLAIARDIVAGEFGGVLACTSSDGNGTTFTIRLPVPPPGTARPATAA